MPHMLNRYIPYWLRPRGWQEPKAHVRKPKPQSAAKSSVLLGSHEEKSLRHLSRIGLRHRRSGGEMFGALFSFIPNAKRERVVRRHRANREIQIGAHEERFVKMQARRRKTLKQSVLILAGFGLLATVIIFSILFLGAISGVARGATLPVTSATESSVRGTETNLPLPRWAALRAEEARARRGPGKRYPSRWVYHRRGLPLRIVDEHDTWRLVRDWEGSEGWIHTSLLRGDARFQVVGAWQNLHNAPAADAVIEARLEAGVTGELLRCRGGWCEVQAPESRRGWLPRDAFFGGFPPE